MEHCRRRILRAGGLAIAGALAGCGGRSGSPVDGTTTGTDTGTTTGTDTGTSTRATDPVRTTTADPRSSDDPGETDGTRETTTGSADNARLDTPQSVEGGRVAVVALGIRDSVILEGPEPFGIDAADDGRWVFVRVETAGVRIDPNALQLATDGDRYRGTVEVGALSLAGFDRFYGRAMGPGDDEGWVAFRVPAPLRTESAQVVLDDAAWQVPNPAVDRLRSPKPAFELVGIRAPDAVETGEPLTVEFGVRNVGDRPGTFRAVAYATAPGFQGFGNRAYERAIPVGGRETFVWRSGRWERFLGDGSDPTAVEVHLDVPGGERTEPVPVAGSTTGDG